MTLPTPVVCALCLSDETKLLFKMQDRNIVQCKNCRLVYINPWIEDESLYAVNYFTERNRYIERIDDFKPIFEDILEQIENYKDKGKLLDVGCGPGLLLAIARDRGWDVAGVEISEWAAQYANEELDIPVVHGPLAANSFSKGSFDVIIANHSLEHMPEPNETIKILSGFLKDDGLLMIGVPNFGSLMAKFKKAKWASLLPDQHRWQFTPQTLSILLEKNNFQVIDITFQNHDYIGRGLKRFILKNISLLALKLKFGEAMLVFANKSAKVSMCKD